MYVQRQRVADRKKKLKWRTDQFGHTFYITAEKSYYSIIGR
jgi:hypothetical protein